MELLGDVGHVESHFGPFGDIVSVDAKIGALFEPNVPYAKKSFWTHPMVLLGDKAQVVARFVPFGDSVILMQDRCTVCTERTIGSEIILDAPNVHLGDEAQLVAHFSPFGDSVSLTQDRCMDCTEHTIGSEIILDAPDGTPR